MTQEQPIPQIIFLGDTNVGKTCIITRQERGVFFEENQTVGVNTHKINIQGKMISVWDTAGQERFRSITNQYYQKKNVAVLVFDLTNPQTFDNLNYWKEELQSNELNANLIIVGNKSDLTEQAVTDNELKTYAESINAEYFKTSALTGENIPELFEAITVLGYQSPPVKADPPQPIEESSKCC